jgi:arabinofuranosyltransferase
MTADGPARARSVARWTGLGLAAAVAVYAWLAWDHRWLADDGLIVVRTARQILAGNGPVYSSIERAEPSTSTLWMWLVAGAAWLTGANPARLAVGLGGALSIGGLAIALDATRRVHRAAGSTQVVVPAGALVVLGVFPFWDFATSGLETGLGLCWLAVIWWLVGALRPDHGHPRWAATAVVIGLGPLVRPDFAIATAVFGVAAWAIVRPRWRAAAWLAGCALALPVGYEVFRAGYYGALVPLPAIAKSATDSEWQRGLAYLRHFVAPHLLYVAFAALAALAILGRRTIAARPVVVAAPLVTAAVMAIFVVRVGGDFMHARLLLPATWLAIAPVLVVPVRRAALPALAILTAWALFNGSRDYTDRRTVSHNERRGYQRLTQARNPTDDSDYRRAFGHVAAQVDDALHTHHPVVLSEGGQLRVPIAQGHEAPVAVLAGRLGGIGAITPLDGIVVDIYGLANPVGARITRTQPGMTGHEKRLPMAWALAELVDPSGAPFGSPSELSSAGTAVPPELTVATTAELVAARHALGCGELAELEASVRAPLTPARFWANLTGAVARTRLVIPADPVQAEQRFCRRL